MNVESYSAGVFWSKAAADKCAMEHIEWGHLDVWIEVDLGCYWVNFSVRWL